MAAFNRWYFVRHAPVIGAATTLYQTHDEPADTNDPTAFAALAKLLPGDAIWFTSPLKRTRQTADAILAAGAVPRERHEDARLSEQHMGDWHGQELHELRKLVPDMRHKFWFTDAETRPSNGESFLDQLDRVSDFLDETNARLSGQTIIAICHGGTIRAAMSHALGLEPDVSLGISAENLSTTRLDYRAGDGKGGNWRLVFTNIRAS